MHSSNKLTRLGQHVCALTGKIKGLWFLRCLMLIGIVTRETAFNIKMIFATNVPLG